MKDNVIPLRRGDSLRVFKGRLEHGMADPIITEQVGVAELPYNASVFQMTLWMFPQEEYLVFSRDYSRSIYGIFSPDHEDPQRDRRPIGKGYAIGNFIRLKFHLFPTDLFIELVRGREDGVELEAA